MVLMTTVNCGATHPVAVPVADGMEHCGVFVRLKELWRYVLFDEHRLPLTHPHEHHALERPGREGASLQTPDHLGIWPFSDELDTFLLAIEGGPMVCAA
jgi:hypothetical protein